MSSNSHEKAIAIPQSDPSIAPIISTLENLFQQLNNLFFESALSKPVITVSPDPQRKDRIGWCTPRRVWFDGGDEGYYENNVCAEFLNRPIEEICETLMHNMVHQFNAEKGVKDTSRGGTYHNDEFRNAAEEHGLVATKGTKYGYSETALAPETEELIRALDLSQFDLFRDSGIPVNDPNQGC